MARKRGLRGLFGRGRSRSDEEPARTSLRPLFVLEVSSGPDAGRHFTVFETDTALGRSASAGARPGSVRLSDPSISSLQAVIHFLGDRAEIAHVSAATNPTRLNDQQLERSPLVVGDRIQLGRSVLEVHAPQREPSHHRSESIVLAKSGESLPRAATLLAAEAERPEEVAAGHLMVIAGLPNAIGTTFPIYAPQVSIGRSKKCDVTIPEETVSRRHCVLEWESGVVVLVQHSLVNPTLVNGHQVKDRCVIESGDEVQVADQVVLRVELAEAPEPVLAEDAPAQPAIEADAGEAPVATDERLANEPPPTPGVAGPSEPAPVSEAIASAGVPAEPPAAPVAAEPDAAPPAAPRPEVPRPEAPAPARISIVAEVPTPREDLDPATATGPAPPKRVEIAIIGAGPAGIAAAVQAATHGTSHVLLERTKLANSIERYQKGKWVMDEPPLLPLREELQVGFEAGTREAILGEWQRGIQACGANLFVGPAYELTGLSGESGDFLLQLRGGASLRAGRVVLSIGVQGNLRAFGVPGDDLPHVTYQLDDPAEHENKRIVVVGVGDAGIENALALAEYGNEVSIVNRREEFDRAKPRNRSLIENAIKTGEIVHHTNANTERFEPGAIVLRTNNGELRLDADLVIGRLGAIPPRKFLESVGIEMPSDDPAAVPSVSESYESSVPGLHLVGALAGYPLIKNCMNQGCEVIDHILGHDVTPADENVLHDKFAGLEGTVNEVLARIQQTALVFSRLTTIQLREFLFESDVCRLAAGDVVFERNDFTNSFYTVLEGSLEARVPSSDHDEDMDLAERERNERRVAIGPGEFFGEIGLISGRRRSATVVAQSDSVVIETPRMAMNKLIRSVEHVSQIVDAVYTERSLFALVPDATPEERLALANSAEIRVFKPGDHLFREGDEPDGLHLIRRGAATVSQSFDGLDHVIQYVQAGIYVGETSLLVEGRTRSASVRATVLTETVLLPTSSVMPFVAAQPALKRELEQRARDYAMADAQRQAERGSRGTVMFLMAKGAHEATDLLLIDEALCIRCDNCEKACADTHAGVSRLDREAGATYATTRGSQLHIPTACQHCENPKCMDDCPPDALRRDPDGEVYIKDNCIGCGNCVVNCPYDVIQMAKVREYRPRGILGRLLFGEAANPFASDGSESGGVEKAVKCDLCRNQPAMRDGRDKAACVSSCPTGAIVRVNPRDYVDELLTQ